MAYSKCFINITLKVMCVFVFMQACVCVHVVQIWASKGGRMCLRTRVGRRENVAHPCSKSSGTGAELSRG